MDIAMNALVIRVSWFHFKATFHQRWSGYLKY